MRITEAILKDNLKHGKLARMYYFYGRESFLVRHYAERVREVFAPVFDEFNLVKFSGLPDIAALGEAIETLPVFADKKAVMINDLDAEKTDADTLEQLIAVLSDIPEYCIIIIANTGIDVNVKSAKTKKLLACIEQFGIICEFLLLTRAKAAEQIVKKAARSGCVISRPNAEYLYDLTLGSLVTIGNEMDKLCAYAGKGGEITKETIGLLTPRLTETEVRQLVSALTNKNAGKAFAILDDLFAQNLAPHSILGYMSAVYISKYRENTGNNYAKNCIRVLYKANIRLNSSSLSNRTVLEKAMAEILVS